MSTQSKFSFGALFFWLVLLGLSAGAFTVGFHYTYGATANVNTKTPGADELAAKPPVAKPAEPVKPIAKASPTQAPGLVAMSSAEPSEASPSPKPTAKPSPSPAMVGIIPVSTPQPTPTPRRAPDAPPKPEVYRVQVGGFEDRETAQKQVEELQGAGINAVVVYDEGKYHAQLGAFTDRTRALSVADEVNIRGYSVTIRH